MNVSADMQEWTKWVLSTQNYGEGCGQVIYFLWNQCMTEHHVSPVTLTTTASQFALPLASSTLLSYPLFSTPLCCPTFSCSRFLPPKLSPSSPLFCPPPLLLSPFLRARLWSVDRISGKLFGNPNLSEIIWLQPPITCWFGGIRSSLRSNDFHFVFEL